MFILPMPESTKMLSFRADDQMTYCLSDLATRLQTSRSTLIRVAIANLLKEARSTQPIRLQEVFHGNT
jgi:predicted transcriptional regulator